MKKLASETIASMAVRIGADISDFEKNMKEFRRTFGKLGQQVQEAGRQIGTAFTAAGGAIAVGLGFAVKKGMEFDGQMSRVGAIAGATGSDFQALRKSALDLGASTSKSATEVAQGMELMAQKGYDAQQIIAAMPGVISAAEASGEDMALVADTVASALNAFGLEANEASRVADVLAMSANTSAAGVEDLQYAFKYAAPLAKQLGISMEELAASTGIMADAGMRGEQAGTTLRAALIRLADPPKEARKALENLGISVTDSSGKFKPFGSIIGEFSQKLAGMTDAQKVATLSQIFGTEAATGMLSVIAKGPEEFGKLTKALEESGGTSQKVAALMKQNLKGTFEELSGAIETAQILFSDALAPAIKVVTEGIRDIVSWFNTLSPQTQKFIAIGAAVTAALLLVVGAVGFLIMGLGALAAAEWAVILPIAGLVAGIAAGIAVIVALGFALVEAYKRSEAFRNVINQVWLAIQAGLQALWAFVQPAIQAISGFILSQFEKVKSWWEGTWPTLQRAFVNIWNAIWFFIQPIVNGIVSLFQWAWPLVKAIVLDTWASIKNIISSALTIVMNIIDAFANLFTGNWSGLWENVKAIFANTLILVWNYLQLWGLGKVLKLFGFIGKEIVSILSGLTRKVLNWAIDFAKPFIDLATKAIKWGVNIITGLWNGISSMVPWIEGKVYGFVSSIGKTIKKFFGISSPSKLMAEYGRYIAEGLAKGIEENKDKPAQMTVVMAQAIRDAVSKMLQQIKTYTEIMNAEFSAIFGDNNLSKLMKSQGELDRLNKEMDISNNRLALLKHAYNDMVSSIGANAEESKKLYLEIKKEEAAQVDLKNKILDTNKAIEEQKKAMRDLQKNVADVVTKFNHDLAQAQAEYEQKVSESNKRLAEGIRDLNDQYQRAVADRSKSLANFTGLFDAVGKKNVSGEGLLNNLRGQLETFKNWAKNIAELAKRGIQGGLLEQLRQMGPGAASEIEALTTLTDGQLNEYASLWKEKQEIANTEAVNELENLKSQTAQKISELISNTQLQLAQYKAEWEKKNSDIVAEMNKSMQELVEKAKNGGIEFLVALRQGLDEQMPMLMSKLQSIKSQVESVVSSIRSSIQSAAMSSLSSTLREYRRQWNLATDSAAREAIHQAANAVREAAGLRAGIDYDPNSGALLRDIPGLADGGIVTSPTLAMIGEGREKEAILPLSKLDSMLSGSGGSGVSLVVNVYGSVGVDDIGDQIVRKLAQAGVIAR